MMTSEVVGSRWRVSPAGGIGSFLVGMALGICGSGAVAGQDQTARPDRATAEALQDSPERGGGARVARVSEVTERARGYVRQLGDPNFAAREQARQELIALGLPALPALEQGSLHADREIRHGSRRLLAMIQLHDFQRRLDAFAADVGGESDFGLPAWKLFRDTFGESPTTRSFFVEMLRAEAGLLQALDEGVREAANVLGIRTQQLQQATVRSELIPVGGIAAMLFVMGQDEFAGSTLASQIIFQACMQAHFHKAMTEGGSQRILRALLGRSIDKATDWPAYLAMQLAMRYDLAEGLGPARRVLEDQARNQNLHFLRQFAILTFAKFGDSTHAPLLETLLDDATTCSSMTINMIRYETQIRDVALAALWKIHGENPARHGFGDRVQLNTQTVFNTGTLGFADEAARIAALEKWYAFREGE